MRFRDPVLRAPEGWSPPPERLTFVPLSPPPARILGRATNVRLIVEVALSRHAASLTVEERTSIADAAGAHALDLFTTGAQS